MEGQEEGDSNMWIRPLGELTVQTFNYMYANFETGLGLKPAPKYYTSSPVDNAVFTGRTYPLHFNNTGRQRGYTLTQYLI